MSLVEKIEAVLFAVGKPVAMDYLKKFLDSDQTDLVAAVKQLKKRLNTDTSGIHLIDHDGKLQLATNPALAGLVATIIKEELTGELTRPSLETLTIIAYRGPITKPEIEQIRGINCSLILRNLLIRGLIDEKYDPVRLQPVYYLSNNFLRHLGVHQVEELPNYQELHAHESLDQVLAEIEINV